MDKMKIRDLVLKEEAQGNVVYMTGDGLAVADLNDFISQPAEGILYDLNRDRGTVLTFIDDPKFINDFAVGMVIRRLKEQLGEAIRGA